GFIRVRCFIDQFHSKGIVALYGRFCQLDRDGGGFVSADKFMSLPEFAANPLSQILPLPLPLPLHLNDKMTEFHTRLLTTVNELNFKEFVGFLSNFSPRASLMYDVECHGKVTFDNMLDIMRDLTRQYISEQQWQ
ncbi:hypothetical protein RJ641_025432, partial [Dillenia turbinata]